MVNFSPVFFSLFNYKYQKNTLLIFHSSFTAHVEKTKQEKKQNLVLFSACSWLGS